MLSDFYMSYITDHSIYASHHLRRWRNILMKESNNTDMHRRSFNFNLKQDYKSVSEITQHFL